MGGRATTSALLCCVLATAVAGCGTSDDRDKARAVAEGLYAAFNAKDGRAACRRLSPQTRSELESQEGKQCADAILSLKLKGSRAASVDVYLDDAIVRLQGGDTVFLGDTHDGWRVEAVGCKGETTTMPADCEVQA